jgi:hypothetical protein
MEDANERMGRRGERERGRKDWGINSPFEGGKGDVLNE